MTTATTTATRKPKSKPFADLFCPHCGHKGNLCVDLESATFAAMEARWLKLLRRVEAADSFADGEMDAK